MESINNKNNFIIYLNNKMKEELLVPDIFKLAEEIKEYKIKLDEETNKILANEYFKIGFEFYELEKYSLMIQYYLKAIDKCNTDAMNNLGYHYDAIEKDYPKMIQYYLMAINQGNSHAMFNLGLYYQDVEKDYPKMIQYYLMAINQGNSDAMFNLAIYYQEVEKDNLKFYKELNKIENKNDLIINKIYELKRLEEIKNYESM